MNEVGVGNGMNEGVLEIGTSFYCGLTFTIPMYRSFVTEDKNSCLAPPVHLITC